MICPRACQSRIIPAAPSNSSCGHGSLLAGSSPSGFRSCCSAFPLHLFALDHACTAFSRTRRCREQLFLPAQAMVVPEGPRIMQPQRDHLYADPPAEMQLMSDGTLGSPWFPLSPALPLCPPVRSVSAQVPVTCLTMLPRMRMSAPSSAAHVDAIRGFTDASDCKRTVRTQTTCSNCSLHPSRP
jgi:hypothetical protein